MVTAPIATPFLYTYTVPSWMAVALKVSPETKVAPNVARVTVPPLTVITVTLLVPFRYVTRMYLLGVEAEPPPAFKTRLGSRPSPLVGALEKM